MQDLRERESCAVPSVEGVRLSALHVEHADDGRKAAASELAMQWNG